MLKIKRVEFSELIESEIISKLHNNILIFCSRLCIIEAGDEMNLILSTVLEEKKRIDFMLQRYEEQLSALPKGTISEKKVKGNTYYYLKYRDGKKVVSRYVGKQEVEKLRGQIDRRRHMETMVKSLQEEQALANRILEGNL